ncbi:unnamed protein product [Prunus armeniaca]
MDLPKPPALVQDLVLLENGGIRHKQKAHLQMGWDVVKGKWNKLSHVPEFKDQAPKMLRKDRDALGNTLLGMRSLWHESKIVMSLALKRKLSVPGRGEGVLRYEMKSLQRDLIENKEKEKMGDLSIISGSLTVTLSNARATCKKGEKRGGG